jgi:DNA-binding beta-propeller fold protein YncE
LLGSASLGPTNLGAEDARLAPDGGTLWVVDTGGRAVSAFAVEGGELAQLPTSPTALPAGAAPFGVVVT